MKTSPLTRTSSPSTTTQPLSDEAQTLFDRIRTDYGINDSGGIVILQCACESFDRMREAQAHLEEDGVVFRDRHGQIKPHPCVVIERDSRTAMLAALKALHFDLEPLKGIGRPPGVLSMIGRRNDYAD